jgi:hypothetical protein
MIYRLVILNGERRGERVTVTREPMVLGRAETCGLRLNDPEIALEHAEISHTPEGLFIRDLGSMNRLLINNREAREVHPKHGDVIEVGQTRFLVQAYVQAEVQGEKEGHLRRYTQWLPGIGAVLVMLGLLYALFQCRPTLPQKSTRPDQPVSIRSNATLRSKTPPPPPVPTLAVEPESPPPQPPEKDVTPATEPAVAPQVEPVPSAATPPPNGPSSSPERSVPAESNAASDTIAIARQELEAAANALLESKVRDMMEEAQNLASNKGPAAAEQLLAAIETIKPDFLDASVARAALLEEQGKLEPAVALWTHIRERASAAPLAEQAAAKLKRLTRAREELVFPFVGRIKIVEAGISKFPETEQYRDMRLLNIRLVATELQKELDTDAVRVEIRFYDRDPKTGKIGPTRARVPTAPLPVQGPWRATEEKTVEASYVAPIPDNNAPPVQYYGFVLRVHYYGALQEERIQPRDLPADVELAPPSEGSVTPGTNTAPPVQQPGSAQPL